MKRITIELLLENWVKVEPNLPLIEPANQFFDEWEDDDGVKCDGMRRRETLKPHGIVRCVVPNGNVMDATYNNGLRHGLQVNVTQTHTAIELYKNGEKVSSFVFDQAFQEFERQGNLLDELTPDWFNPNVSEPRAFRLSE